MPWSSLIIMWPFNVHIYLNWWDTYFERSERSPNQLSQEESVTQWDERRIMMRIKTVKRNVEKILFLWVDTTRNHCFKSNMCSKDSFLPSMIYIYYIYISRYIYICMCVSATVAYIPALTRCHPNTMKGQKETKQSPTTPTALELDNETTYK